MKTYQIVLVVIAALVLAYLILHYFSRSKNKAQLPQSKTVTNSAGAILFKKDDTVDLGFSPANTNIDISRNTNLTALPNPLPIPLTVPYNTQVIVTEKKISPITAKMSFTGIIPNDYIFYRIETGWLNAKDLS